MSDFENLQQEVLVGLEEELVGRRSRFNQRENGIAGNIQSIA